MKASDQLIRDLAAARLSLDHAYRQELCDSVDRKFLKDFAQEASMLEAELRRLKSLLGLNIRIDRL